MQNYDDVCYKKAFLKDVIVRVDFPVDMFAISGALEGELKQAALKRFPIYEPTDFDEQTISIHESSVVTNRRKVMESTFHGKEHEKTLKLSNDYILQTAKAYKTYDLFKEDFLSVLEKVMPHSEKLTASRVGIRYVNVIELEEGDPLTWDDYLNESMLGIIDLGGQKNHVTRAFHILEYDYDGISIKYQFGIANPDYPSLVKRKHFVLDIDGYVHGAIELKDIQKIIDDSHKIIQEIFENSITDKTRNLMS